MTLDVALTTLRFFTTASSRRTCTAIAVRASTTLPRASAESRRRTARPELRPRTGLVPRKVRPSLTICRRNSIVWITLPQLTVPSPAVVSPVGAIPIDTTTDTKPRRTCRSSAVRPTTPVPRLRPICRPAEVGPSLAEAVLRAAVAEAAADAGHAGRASAVSRLAPGRNGCDADIVVEPQVGAVILQIRNTLNGVCRFITDSARARPGRYQAPKSRCQVAYMEYIPVEISLLRLVHLHRDARNCPQYNGS